MADEWFQRLEEAMGRIWFQQNILLTGSVRISLETTADTGSSPPPPPQHPAAASEGKSDEGIGHHGYRKKRPTRLNLVTSEHLFQIPALPLTTSGRRRSSMSSSTEGSPQSSNISRRRPTKAIRSYKSMSELEQDELKGFMDLGFVFHKESLSPRMMSVIPGLQRLGQEADSGEQPSEGEEAGMQERVRRPYLAESWPINRPDSPLLNLRMLPGSSTEGADMKRQLRFWARSVASTIHQES